MGLRMGQAAQGVWRATAPPAGCCMACLRLRVRPAVSHRSLYDGCPGLRGTWQRARTSVVMRCGVPPGSSASLTIKSCTL